MVEGDSLSENHDFPTTEHPVDPRPVCKLEFVRCGPVEKNATKQTRQHAGEKNAKWNIPSAMCASSMKKC